ncbi:MAG: hypothetical protein QXI16_07250 [Sulfolobaceae archaeon]
MVVEGLMSVVFGIVNLLLMPLNIVNLIVDSSAFTPILEFINMALYLIPFRQLMPIFSFFVGLMMFRIVIAFIKTIWDLLPLV